MMQSTKPLAYNAALEMEQALERMPIRSSGRARQMVKAALPIPETRQDIERYVLTLLTRDEQAVCDMATD
jgi:hypothetical protein